MSSQREVTVTYEDIQEETKIEKKTEPTSSEKVAEEKADIKEIENKEEKQEEKLDLNELQLKGETEKKEIDFDTIYSTKTFEMLGIRPNIIESLYIDMKFEKPTLVQAEVLPSILDNPPRNIIAQSKNGTGKTACFCIGMLSRVNPRIAEPQAICLCTTREIAKQTFEVLQKIGSRCEMNFQLIVPQEEVYENRNEMITGHVLVGTVGAIRNCIRNRRLSMNNMRIIVIDEADDMFKQQDTKDKRSMSLSEQARFIIRSIPRDVESQLLLFSATFSETVFTFIQRVATNAVIFRKKDKELKLENVPLYYISCKTDEDKVNAIMNLYKNMIVNQAIIFFNRTADILHMKSIFDHKNMKCECLFGDMEPKFRDFIIDNYKNGEIKVLLATNVIARGFDCSTVTLVVNYDIPMDNRHVDYENLLHRIGRTGRMGKKGLAVSLIKNEEDMSCLKGVEEKYDMKMIQIDPEDDEQIAEELKKCDQYNKAQKKN